MGKETPRGWGFGGGGTILACMHRLPTGLSTCLVALRSMWRDQKAIERLEDRCRALEGKCEDLERGRKSIELEFTELYDKVSHQMSRMAKRNARAEKEAEPETEIASANSLDGIDPISKSIMLRRGMPGVSK